MAAREAGQHNPWMTPVVLSSAEYGLKATDSQCFRPKRPFVVRVGNDS